MDISDITVKTKGFFQDLTYTADLHMLYGPFASEFKLAEKLILILEEEVVLSQITTYPDPISVSTDGKEIIITYKGRRFYKEKTKLTEPVTPIELFSALNRIFNRAVIEDNERFERLETNQEEEE